MDAEFVESSALHMGRNQRKALRVSAVKYLNIVTILTKTFYIHTTEAEDNEAQEFCSIMLKEPTPVETTWSLPDLCFPWEDEYENERVSAILLLPSSILSPTQVEGQVEDNGMTLRVTIEYPPLFFRSDELLSAFPHSKTLGEGHSKAISLKNAI